MSRVQPYVGNTNTLDYDSYSLASVISLRLNGKKKEEIGKRKEKGVKWKDGGRKREGEEKKKTKKR